MRRYLEFWETRGMTAFYWLPDPTLLGPGGMVGGGAGRCLDCWVVCCPLGRFCSLNNWIYGHTGDKPVVNYESALMYDQQGVFMFWLENPNHPWLL